MCIRQCQPLKTVQKKWATGLPHSCRHLPTCWPHSFRADDDDYELNSDDAILEAEGEAKLREALEAFERGGMSNDAMCSV